MTIESSIFYQSGIDYQSAIDNLMKGGKPLEMEVANAIIKIKEIADRNPDARWGRVPLSSEKNMSWVITNTLKPIFEKMRIGPDSFELNVLNYLPNLNKNSRSAEMQELFFSFKDICRMYERNSQEMNIFAELYGLFTIVFSSFEVRSKRKTKRGGGCYCVYCYREIWHSGEHRLGGDTCHVHSDFSRTLGKYHLPKYEKFKKYLIKNYLIDDSIYKYQVNRLKKLGIPQWDITKDRNTWFSVAMKEIDACPPYKIEALSLSLADENYGHPNQENWPGQFSGTFLRYIAFHFATQRKPSNGVRDRMESIWKGNSPPEVTKKYNVSRQNLHQQLKKWSKEINDLRDMELSDDVIKFVFDFKLLPNRKIVD